MASVAPLVDECTRFGGDFSAGSNACLRNAAACPAADAAEAHLSEAARFSSQSRVLDLARYKFYLYRGQP
jgi:hypothetical protein